MAIHMILEVHEMIIKVHKIITNRSVVDHNCSTIEAHNQSTLITQVQEMKTETYLILIEVH